MYVYPSNVILDERKKWNPIKSNLFLLKNEKNKG